MTQELYSRSPDVLWRTTTDRVLLRPVRGEGLVSLTGSGTTLWELLATPISFEDLVTTMAAYYQVDIGVVRDSVAAALADMEQVNLVVHQPDDSLMKFSVPEHQSSFQAAQ